jgi:predicted RNA binding protein YcfA (HicA-like mRNA interferase family)
MTQWPSRKARQVLAALLRIGWRVKRDTAGSHRILSHPDRPDFVFSFHDSEEIGPRMLARIAKHTGLTPDDL